MSFQIKDKKKISTFRKCVQILTASMEEFHIHLTKTHIRLFNTQQDDSTYMIDFQAPWFSKFVAPEFFDNVNFGIIQVIKTREHYVIEANVPFEIERDIKSDENYEFPENQLLIDAEVKNIKSLKGVFKSNAKSEILQIAFQENGLSFRSEQGTNRFGYEMKREQLQSYGNYLSASGEKESQYVISMALKHILGLIKVSELMEGRFFSAMELIEENSCVCFLFTHSQSRDFKFCIGMANVKFQLLTELQQEEDLRLAAVSRLRKVEPTVIKKEPKPNQSDIPIQALNLKSEIINEVRQGVVEENDDEIEMIDTSTNARQKKGKKQNNQKKQQKNVVQDEEEQELLEDVENHIEEFFNDENQDENIQVRQEIKEEYQQNGNDDDNETTNQDQSADVKRKRHHRKGGENKKKKQVKSNQVEVDDDESDQEDIQARKADFYKEVDKEEFF